MLIIAACPPSSQPQVGAIFKGYFLLSNTVLTTICELFIELFTGLTLFFLPRGMSPVGTFYCHFSPNYGGKNCPGSQFRGIVCSNEECSGLSPDEFATEECKRQIKTGEVSDDILTGEGFQCEFRQTLQVEKKEFQCCLTYQIQNCDLSRLATFGTLL